MSGNVLTYDPASVNIIICGYKIPGLVSVSLRWDSEIFTPYKGIRGVHTRVYNQDRKCTLILELLPSSIANDVFSQIVLQDAAYNSGRLEIFMNDTSGTTRFESVEAYLRTFPEVTFNAEGINTRKWEVEILSFVSGSGNVGGNASNGIDINDILSKAMSSVDGAISSGLDAISGYF